MKLEDADRRDWLRWTGYSFVIWSVLAPIFMVQVYQLNVSRAQRAPDVVVGLIHPLIRYWIYALLTIPIIWTAKRFPITGRKKLTALLIHIAAYFVFVSAFVLIRIVLFSAFPELRMRPGPFFAELHWWLTRASIESLWVYAAIVCFAHAMHYYLDSRRTEARETALRTLVTEHELQILRLQLHPHFIFNALNGISALVKEDPDRAQTMIAELSDLLRRALETSPFREVPLREELDFVRAYLLLQQMRLGDRLQLVFSIDDATLDALVPNFLLQPLVENAIRHGIEQTRGGGTVSISSQKTQSRLCLEVADDGPVTSGQFTRGVGLSNCEERLRRIYSHDYELKIKPRRDSGLEVVVDVPFRNMTMEVPT